MATATKRARSAARVGKPARGGSTGGNEVRVLRKRYGLSQGLLARLLDVSLRSVSGAESRGDMPVQLRRSFTQVSRLCDALGEVMEAGFVGEWLDRPNEMLGGLKPVEAMERGRLDVVWQVVEGLRAGMGV